MCSPCGVTVCGCVLPTTLFATLDSPCAAIDGDVITLTWDGVGQWTGTYSPGGGCSANMPVAFSIGPAGQACQGALSIGDCYSSESVPFVATPSNCENIEITDPGTWDGGVSGCGCCGFTTLTVTVTP